MVATGLKVEKIIVYLAKDFIETAEGLVFAVVESGLEQEKILCFLRYIKHQQAWKKLNTEQANQYLTSHYPQYLYFSEAKQAHCHALAVEDVYRHYQPRKRIQEMLQQDQLDDVERDCVRLCRLFQRQGMDIEQIGVTGSLLVCAENSQSDIDLVFYCRKAFHQARKLTKHLIISGDCGELDSADWQASFDRRQCDLSYDDYVWHERRKYNKAMINRRKFDLNLVPEKIVDQHVKQYQKLKKITLKTQVVGDNLAFDYPAEFAIDHPQIHSIVCYTATYTGQAVSGEWVEVSGWLEQCDDGQQRIVVGSDREARGQYIKVLNDSIA